MNQITAETKVTAINNPQPTLARKNSIQRAMSGQCGEAKEEGVRKQKAATQATQLWKTEREVNKVKIIGKIIME